MKRSNTANVDPRTINFADVKRRLEDKIDKINSYQSKRGTYRDATSPNMPSFSQNRPPLSANKFSNLNQKSPQPSFQQNEPKPSYQEDQNSGAYNSGYNNSALNSQNNPYANKGFGQSPSRYIPQSDYYKANTNENPYENTNLNNSPYGYNPKGGNLRRDNRDLDEDLRQGQNSSTINIGSPSVAGYQYENKDNTGRDNYYDIHKKLDFFEQERLNDLRARAGDSKISYLANNLEKVEGRLESLQNSPVARGAISPVDVSLEIIQRKLDKLEQDRIDSLRAKIEQEKTKELERSIEKLSSKIENSYASGHTLYNRQSSDLIDLIQKKIDKLEQDNLDSLKSRLDEERTSEIAKNLERIEAKLANSVDRTVIDKTAYLDAISKEDLLRKIEKLEQDRINDVKMLMDQEKILLLNKQIESLEGKVEQALNKSVVEKNSLDVSSEIAKKLEKLEQDKAEELRAKKEEEKLLALSRSLSNIESKLGEKQAIETTSSGAIEEFLQNISARLQHLEQERYHDVNNKFSDSSSLEKSLANLESKIEKISQPTVTDKIDSRYSSILEGIERKLERLERDKQDEYREKTDNEKLQELTRSLERIENSLTRTSYPTAVEGDGFGKKLDKLEQDIRSSLDREKISDLQRSLDKIESKLDTPTPSRPSVNYELSTAFVELSKRLDNLEKKRLEERDYKTNIYNDSKLASVLEKIDSKITSSIESNLNNNSKEKDFVLEEIQRKLRKLEDSKSTDYLLKTEKDKFNDLSNHLEKLDSKINTIALKNEKDPALDEVSKLAEKIKKIEQEKLEEIKEKNNLDRFAYINSKLEKIENKLAEDNSVKGEKNESSSVLEDLNKKIEKQQEKIAELHSKIEQEKLESLNRHIGNLEKKIGCEDSSILDKNLSLLEEIKEKLETLVSKENISINSSLLKIKDRIVNLESKKNEPDSLLLLEIKNKLDSISNNKDNEFNKNQLLIDIDSRLKKLESNSLLSSQNEILLDIKKSLDILKPKEDSSNNLLLLDLKNKVDNLSLQNKEVNASSLIDIKNILDIFKIKESKEITNEVLLDLKNRLEKLSYNQQNNVNPVLLEIKNTLNKLSSQKEETNTLLLMELKNKLSSFTNSNSVLQDDSLKEIRQKIDAIDAKGEKEKELLLNDIKNKIDNLYLKINEDSYSKNFNIYENLVDYKNSNSLDLENIKNQLNTLNSKQNDINNSTLLEIKQKLEKADIQNNKSINLSLSDVNSIVENLKVKSNKEEGTKALFDIKDILDKLKDFNSKNIELEINKKLDTLMYQQKDTNDFFLKELKKNLESISLKNNEAISSILLDLKTIFEILKSENNNIDYNPLLLGVKNKVANIDKTSQSQYEVALHEIKETLDALIKKHNNFEGNPKNIPVVQNKDDFNLNNDELLKLKNKCYEAIIKMEASFKEIQKNEAEIKNHILEQDLANNEILKLKNQLDNEKNIAQKNFLANEINKLKSHIDSKSNLSIDAKNILEDIKNQQNIIRKSIEMIPYKNTSERESPLIEDIRNLLLEVNYRNKVLNEAINDERNDLIKVVKKVDSLAFSIGGIEKVIGNIPGSDSFNEKYKQSLEENFTKLKEDNNKIIEVLKTNNQQSSLLSKKAELLVKSLREDVLNITKLEQKSILEEFSNLKSIVLEFKNFIKTQDDNKGDVAISLSKLISNLDSITNLQEEVLNYFKSLDVNIEKSLTDLKKNSANSHEDILSEIKLYLEDSKNRGQYFNQLKDKLDKNSSDISDFLNKSKGIDVEIASFTSDFKNNIDGLSKAIDSLLQIHNKTTEDLNNLIGKTDKLLESEKDSSLKSKLEEIGYIQQESIKTAQKIDEKTTKIETIINNKVDSLQNNFYKSKEEITDLIKDSKIESVDNISNVQKNLSFLTGEINLLNNKAEEVNTNIIEVKDASNNINKGIKELKTDVNEAQKDINKNVQSNISISMDKFTSLQEKLLNVDSNIKALSEKAEDIKVEVKESKFYLEKASDAVKLILSSVEDINLYDALNNMSERINIIQYKQKDLEDLILSFQTEIKNNLSPYVADKNFAENFDKFVNFSSTSIKNIKESIESFNSNLDMFLVEDKIMTNEQLVDLLTKFEEIMNFQDNFLKVYSLNSDNLIGFANKTEKEVSKVDIKKAKEIHSQVKKSIEDISLKNKEEELKSIVSLNNAKNSKKVDLLANMNYLNEEITKKTKA